MASNVGRKKNKSKIVKFQLFSFWALAVRGRFPTLPSNGTLSFSHASTPRTPVQLPALDLDSPASIWHERGLGVFLTSGGASWYPEFLTYASLLGIPTVLSRRVYMQVLIGSSVFLSRISWNKKMPLLLLNSDSSCVLRSP